MSKKRPMVNLYEPDEAGREQLVYREMNDVEYKVWQADLKAAKSRPEPEHSLIQQLRSMNDDERKTLKELLDA